MLKRHINFSWNIENYSTENHSFDELKPALYFFVVVCLRLLSPIERANSERPRVVTFHNMHLPLTKFKFSMRHAFMPNSVHIRRENMLTHIEWIFIGEVNFHLSEIIQVR